MTKIGRLAATRRYSRSGACSAQMTQIARSARHALRYASTLRVAANQIVHFRPRESRYRYRQRMNTDSAISRLRRDLVLGTLLKALLFTAAMAAVFVLPV